MYRTTTPKKSMNSQNMLPIQLLLGLAMISISMQSVCANAVTPEIPTVSDNESEFIDMMAGDSGLDEKRSNWNSMNNPWGKRSGQDVDFSDGDIVPVLITSMDPRLNLQVAFLTNADTLEHLASPQRLAITSMENTDLEDNILNEKRAWKSMNAPWGKRRNGQTWNKFKSPWGKREPNWNNLKGMWGKRSNKDWQKLQPGWGKRAQQYSEMN